MNKSKVNWCTIPRIDMPNTHRINIPSTPNLSRHDACLTKQRPLTQKIMFLWQISPMICRSLRRPTIFWTQESGHIVHYQRSCFKPWSLSFIRQLLMDTINKGSKALFKGFDFFYSEHYLLREYYDYYNQSFEY